MFFICDFCSQDKHDVCDGTVHVTGVSYKFDCVCALNSHDPLGEN